MQYDELMKILTTRRTARLVSKNSIPEEDILKIIDAGKLAPSADKLFNYKVYALTNSESGKLAKIRLMHHFRCGGSTPEDPLGGGEVIQPIMSGLTLIYSITVLPTDPQASPASRDAMINATFSMLAAETLGYKTAFFGIIPDKQGAMKVINPEKTINEYMLMAVTCATDSCKDPGYTSKFNYEGTLFIYEPEKDRAWAKMVEGDDSISFVHLMKHQRKVNSAELIVI
jgi:hypothetical protein